MGGTKAEVISLDKKGRLLIPKSIREAAGIEDDVIIEQEEAAITVRPLAKITDPLEFLTSLRIGKPGLSPVQSKREAEGIFMRRR